MSGFRLAFVTDQHINLENENSLGIDVCGNFLRLLDVIKTSSFDAVVLGGDLCFDQGDGEIYRWFHKKLQELKIPVTIIPGNHDSPVLIHEIFGGFPLRGENEYYGKTMYGFGPMFFLDTSKGKMSSQQYAWLENELENLDFDQVYICMHYPPIITGSMHMDSRYSFSQLDTFQQLTQKFTQLEFNIFAGHCHIERTIIQKNVRVFITPSSYVNIDPEKEYFQPLTSQKTGYRSCVWEHGRFYTSVYYLD